ncbi:acireductone synthase [Dokdonella sp.]|uniref:acireductone synthase n=1 Tax=Dokdonella sp. TaxID=2291710 RepID=UPI001B2F0261|nr:acireductone synthase [Dokdonella sp.]MBO9664135.1 acireductone synthase [Dokdonella sp.]
MIQVILTDIEGTTSSISFVKDVLFPYARAHLPAFVEAHAGDADVQHWLQEAAKEGGLPAPTRQQIVDLLIAWIDADRKSTALKALQGMIWKNGYENGEYRSHVYPEVPARLRAWKDAGRSLYVYSSGSAPAQKLLFAHTEAGDLTPLFDGYFDTEVGGKREVDSYRHIAASIGVPPAAILFLSDIVQELDAARAAGLRTTLLARAPTSCPADPVHPCVADFDAVE